MRDVTAIEVKSMERPQGFTYRMIWDVVKAILARNPYAVLTAPAVEPEFKRTFPEQWKRYKKYGQTHSRDAFHAKPARKHFAAQFVKACNRWVQEGHLQEYGPLLWEGHQYCPAPPGWHGGDKVRAFVAARQTPGELQV